MIKNKRGTSNELDQLIKMFLATGELGSWSRNYSICLHGIMNHPIVFDEIRHRIETITTKYKFIVLDPGEDFTNINILDIGL